MSWPQWPAQATPMSNWAGVAGAPVIGAGLGPGPAQAMAPVIGPQMVGAPVVGNPTGAIGTSASTPYTPEQWAAMQHQNWQQWVQWQQQYQQWQQQYGEQYQQSMSALTGQAPPIPTMPVQPPLPVAEVKSALPPLPDVKPPLPPDEPPNSVHHSQSSVNFNSSVPPPGLMHSHPQSLLQTPHHQQQQQRQQQQPFRTSQMSHQQGSKSDVAALRQFDPHSKPNFNQQPPPPYEQDSHQTGPNRQMDQQDFHQQPPPYQQEHSPQQQDSRNRGGSFRRPEYTQEQTFNNRDNNNRYNSTQQQNAPPSLLNMNLSKPASFSDTSGSGSDNQNYRSDNKSDVANKRLGDSMNSYDNPKKNRWENTDNKGGWNANQSPMQNNAPWTPGERLLPPRRNVDDSSVKEKNFNEHGDSTQSKTKWNTNQPTQWSPDSSDKLLNEKDKNFDNFNKHGINQNKGGWNVNQQTQNNQWAQGASTDAEKLVPGSRHLADELLEKEKNFDNFNKHGLKQNKGGWNTNPSQRTTAISSEKLVPVAARPNVEELSDAEKNFDKQFEQWEAQFNKWKEQNAGHPDKQQYKEYEAKWESWRTQLLDRREQMRKKRLGLTGGPAGIEKSITPVPASQSSPFTQTNEISNNSDKKNITEMTPKRDSLLPTPSHQNENVSDEKSDINSDRITATTDDIIQGESLLAQPPKEQRTNVRQRRISQKSETGDNSSSLIAETSYSEIEKNQLADTSYLQSSTKISSGIPGLDLVHDIDKKNEDKSGEQQTKDIENRKGPDLEAISKGINSILGDQKLMNMLSMVSQNKMPLKPSTDHLINTPKEPEIFAGPRPDSSSNLGQSNFNQYDENEQNFSSNAEYNYNDNDDKGCTGPNNFNHFNQQAPPQMNNYNQPPPIMAANNFNRGLPPPSRNEFGHFPSSNEGPGAQDMMHRGPGAQDMMHQGPGAQDMMHQGPGAQDMMHQAPGNRDSHQFQPPNRGGFINNDFNNRPLNRRSNDFNHDREDTDYNNMNNKFNYQGGNDFNEGGMLNRAPNQGPNDFRGSSEFNQFTSNRGANHQNVGPNNLNMNLNRGPNNLNRGPIMGGPSMLNRPGNNFEANRGPNNFGQFPMDRHANDFERGPNQRPNFGPNDSCNLNRGPFDNFNRESPNADFNQDLRNMRPNNRVQNRGNWGANDMAHNRDEWAQNEYQESADVDQCNDSFGMDMNMNEHGDSRGQHSMYDQQQQQQQQHSPIIMNQFKGNRRSGDSVSFDRPGPPNTAPNFESNNRAVSERYWDEALILKPATVVDYGHKSIQKEPEIFIEPIQTFDYGHSSKNVDKNAPEKNFNREPMSKYNRFNDPDYKKHYIEPVSQQQPPKMNIQNRSNSFDEQFKRDKRRYEKFEMFKEREMMQLNSKFDEKPPRTKFVQKERSCEREMQNEQFLNKPNPLDVKVETEKSSTMPIKMIDDLLSAPGRNTRPPRIVLILRGPPGSGKTFLAKLIKDKEVEQGGSAPRILSLDDYFMIEQDKEIIEKDTGRKTTIKEMVYEYEECMETSYRQSLDKAFKKTVTDGFFPFIILDCVNDKLKYFSDMWSFAKQKGFQVYICQMELDVAACTKRNIHHRSEIEIQRLVAGWDQTPQHYLTLDATSLIQSGCISEVEMEQVSDDEDELINDENTEGHVNISKWERMEHSGDKLARLDGISKPLRPKATMEDYLQLDEDVEIPEERPGQKRVRWADLEERRRQDKIRAIGFVVGQTDWNRMMDPTQGGSALTQTKYIERVNKRF